VVNAISGVFVDNIVVWDYITTGVPLYLSWLHHKSRRGSPEGYFIPDPWINSSTQPRQRSGTMHGNGVRISNLCHGNVQQEGTPYPYIRAAETRFSMWSTAVHGVVHSF